MQVSSVSGYEFGEGIFEVKDVALVRGFVPRGVWMWT